ncbi:hypothetical protein ABEB36_005563 [Hypothenemus hampei]|uniref:Uncharacterized protein n=1 Tax=Hypothenemus hampei TaxID=57062 RepID=A0ABD1EZA5_HYPHA
MKIPLVFVCTCAIISIKKSSGSAIGTPFYPLNPDDLSEGDIKEYFDYQRSKRSDPWSSGPNSGDILNQLKLAVVSGLKQKFAQVAKGSAGAVAGASAGFSKGSFSGDSKSIHYDSHPHVDEDKHIDTWDIKKSVLNTLLQAVKAIKGGVLAIKGQLIKGSGYVVAGSGKLLAAGGDKVTSLGKNILSNVVLVHPGHEHYVPHDHGHHPSGPTIVYEPSGPSSSSHGYESHYDSHPYDHHSDKLHGNPAGIIILRKIPATHDKYHSSPSHIDHSVISTYKPTSGPTFGTVVGKFFTAATSLNPSGPAPFSDEDFHNYHHDEGQSFVEEARHQHNEPAPIFQAPVEEDHLQPPEPPSTNYGVPVNDYQSFNNINDHLGAESSAVNEQKIKLTKGEILDHLETSPTLASTEIKVPKDAPQSLQDLKHSVNKKQPTLRVPFSSDYLPQNTLAVSQIVSNSHELNLPSPSDSLTSFLPKEETESFSTFHDQSNEPSSKEQYMKFIGNFPYYKTPIAPPTFKSSNSKDYLSQKMKMLRLQSEQRHRSRPDYKLVKSVSYEITPHGAKRLT